MILRTLGNTALQVSPLGFGAFKIGRNEKIKYPQPYDLPDEPTVAKLLNGVLDLGINLIDTASAYGLSEERIGRHLRTRRAEFLLSTKVGETFENGTSTYDFSAAGIRTSIARSLQRLQTNVLDIVLIHAPAEDLIVLTKTPVVETLQQLRDAGDIRVIGFSGKTIEAAKQALDWADLMMVEFHTQDQSHASIIAEASRRGVGVFIKKGLAAGHLSPAEAIPFVLRTPGVSSLVLGGLSLDHLAENVRIASSL